MNPFAGKSSTERNKIIAAIVLGFVSLTALYFAFGRSIFAGGTTVSVSGKPTPKPSASPSAGNRSTSLPTQEEEALVSTTEPIVYRSNGVESPEPGRNIL